MSSWTHFPPVAGSSVLPASMISQKECLTVTVAFGISGVQVSRILDSIALFRGYPATIRTDQGPEFTCRALDQWAFVSMVLSCA
ncbi:integrase catalytic domain-containing protein [Klebsiella pneumoniae]|uniref:integrase catalytic domain-containing protein n=1 Tax=Klebsiella pneumoniae TaxID=573 RepID=UPI00397503C1